jgi:hypothetical protein
MLVFAIAATTLTASAQVSASAPPVKWHQEYMHGDGYSIYQLPDGGFVFNVANGSATIIITTDNSGNVVSSKAIQINGEPTLLPYFVLTSDGGYALAGMRGDNYALAKADSSGNLVWTQTYNSDAPITYLRSVIQTSDGGFALAGFRQESDEGEGEIWFAKTDSAGSLIWNETLKGPIADCPSQIIQEPDGGYMLSDVSFSLVPNQAYFRLIRTDADGRVLWNQTYGDLDKYRVPECNAAIPTNDGGYLIGGFLAGRNVWVVKTDANGNMEWNQTYGEANDSVICVQQTSDDGYFFAAIKNFTNGWVMKTDDLGNQLWNRSFTGVTFADGLEANYNNVIQAKDGSFLVLGTKDGNAWLANLATPAPESDPLSRPMVWGTVVFAVVAVCVLVGFALVKGQSRSKTNPALNPQK